MVVYLVVVRRTGAFESALMSARAGRLVLAFWSLLVVSVLWIPIAIVMVYAFNPSNIQSWPIPGFTFKWFRIAWEDEDARAALLLSLKAALISTGIALVLGTMVAAVVSALPLLRARGPLVHPHPSDRFAWRRHRHRAASFYSFWGIQFSLWTIVIGHATFCVVIVYNNVVARFRRTSPS